MVLRELLEKRSDATFLREMIGFAARRLMALETELSCGAAPGERGVGERKLKAAYPGGGFSAIIRGPFRAG